MKSLRRLLVKGKVKSKRIDMGYKGEVWIEASKCIPHGGSIGHWNTWHDGEPKRRKCEF